MEDPSQDNIPVHISLFKWFTDIGLFGLRVENNLLKHLVWNSSERAIEQLHSRHALRA